jgi:hypothetical protein
VTKRDDHIQRTIDMEPDLATKDGVNYYRIGAGVPRDDYNAIVSWVKDDAAQGGLDNALHDKYRVDHTPP